MNLGAFRDAARRAAITGALKAALRGAEAERPIFVGASPRSGTTLLRTMLDSHPELAIPRESRFLREAFRQRAEFGDLTSPANRDALITWILDGRGVNESKFGSTKAELAERMREAPGGTLGSIVGTPFATYAENQSKPRWGDKRPAYIRGTGAIFSMFPDAKFVHLVRDPRGSVASMLRVGWFDGSVARGLELWTRSIDAAAQARTTYRSDQFYELKYEELLADPASEITRLAGWLDLDPAGIDEMLAYHVDNDVPASKYHWKVSQPIDRANSATWREALGTEDLALIDAVAGPHLDAFGYPRADLGPAPEDRVAEYQHWVEAKRPGADSSRQLLDPSLMSRITAAQQRFAKLVERLPGR